jgi:hypothetical protein
LLLALVVMAVPRTFKLNQLDPIELQQVVPAAVA